MTTLQRPVVYGGVTMPLGDAISLMQAAGHPQHLIDRWIQGALRL